jgi:hypothetical protein
LVKVCSTYEEEEKCIEDFGGKARWKRTLGRLRRRWVNIIKINVKKIGWG